MYNYYNPDIIIIQIKPPMFGHHKISVIHQWVQPRTKARLVNYTKEMRIQVVY